MGQPSVGVPGFGWSQGKRMIVRVSRKVGHPCRLWELDETYHTASHASFPDNMAAKAQLYKVVFQFLY